ncbi:hypothetical protein [Salinirubrum litoreum]|uniref:DUF8049 domain-containing protein n=1 Tax=Salinirubrum litoreum TaxID=1126234 RepID=A0ABD5RA63_9EURY|nr:hypothetical protein [Salinirubrum litoreum]
MSAIEEFGARADLLVAAVVAGCLVALTLTLEFLLGVGDVSALVRIAPLYVYLLYLVFDNYVPEVVSPVVLWSALSVLVSVGVVVLYAV